MGLDFSKKNKLTISRLAHAAGVGITTIRYYQKRGLLRQPERPTTGGFRSYGEQDLERILLIRQAQELGFTLTEIAELITHVENGNCHAIEALADKKLQTVKAQIGLLQHIRRTLSTLTANCPHEHCDQCLLMQKLRNRTLPLPQKELVEGAAPPT